MTGSLFSVKNVSRSFKDAKTGAELAAIRDLSLEVKGGEFLSLIGPSGCGKTTLLYLMGGFLRPDSGSVRYKGSPVLAPHPERTIIFQEYGLFPWKTVLGNIEFPIKARGVPAGERLELARKSINMVHLGGFENSYLTLTNGDIILNAVPEPAPWLLLAFSLTTVMVFRRRRA